MTISIPENIRGIIFDLDGTLYHMKWFMKPLLTIKLFPHPLLLPRYMSVRKSFSGKDMGNSESLLHAMAEMLAQKSHNRETVFMRSWIQNRFYTAFDRSMPLLRGSRPGVNTVLSNLKQRGYKLGVLSDFAHVEERLGGLAIDCSLFDSLLSSESEGCLKPCTRTLLALAASWHLSPSALLVCGDRNDTDGIAAKQCGMHFLQISDIKHRPNYTYSWTQIKDGLFGLPPVTKPV